jgi:hypothetical protein
LIFTPVRRVCGLLAVALLVLTGCKVDARVDVKVRADGSGTVTARIALDADAVKRLTPTAPLAQAVPLADMRAAGWNVSGWTKVSDGGASVTLTHEFVGQDDLARRLRDLAGENGVLGDPKITRTRSWFGATDSVQINADLRHLSTGVRADPGVAKALTEAGVDVDALDKQLRGQLGKSLTLTLVVHAPGGESSEVRVKAGTVGAAGASSSHTYTDRIVLLAIGVVLLLLALVLTAVSLIARSRRRRAS